MKTVRMLTDQVGGDGEPLKAGQDYTLPLESAEHWLKRSMAIEVEKVDLIDVTAIDSTDKELEIKTAAKESARAANTAAAADNSTPVIDKPADGGATAGKPTKAK